MTAKAIKRPRVVWVVFADDGVMWGVYSSKQQAKNNVTAWRHFAMVAYRLPASKKKVPR